MVNPNSQWFQWMTAQFAHFFAACSIVLSLGLFGHETFALVGFTIYAAIKEFVVDKYVEGQPLLANATDFSFYMAGVGVAALLLHLTGV